MSKTSTSQGIIASPAGSLRVIPLGGLGEIGMNCMVLETDQDILIVDCGLLFSDLDHFGVEFVIPDFTYLKERKDKVRGYLITHGHEDHIGALGFALKSGIDAPIYCSFFTSLMIRERLKEYGLDGKVDIRPFKMGEKIDFDTFKVKTVSVNHSIIDACAMIIDTPAGKIIHTGDFKMDPLPFMGSPIDLNAFKEAGDQGVLLLMSDSTNSEHHEHSASESVVLQKFEQLFAAAEGLIVVSMFSSNVSRLGQVFSLAKRLGKRIAVSGRSMEQNIRLASEAGYIQDAHSILIPVDQASSISRKELIVLSTGCQGEYRASLTRIAMGEDRNIHLEKGDLVIMSSKNIPGNEKAIGKVINELFKQGAQVLYDAVNDLHVSGHACKPELKKMLELTKPKYFVPIHGEYRHLFHHSEIAKETGVKPENILICTNGDVLELSPVSCKKIDRLEETRVLIEGREGNDISKLVLKDRRQLGEKGIVFSLMVRNADSRRIISGPEIICRGIASESIEPWLIEESKTLVKKMVVEHEKAMDQGDAKGDLQEMIRIELRRFFGQNIGKKPVVLPIILDL